MFIHIISGKTRAVQIDMLLGNNVNLEIKQMERFSQNNQCPKSTAA